VDFRRRLFGNDVAAFAGGDNHTAVAGAVFHDMHQRTAEKPHFECFPIAVGNHHDIGTLREIAKRMGAAKSLTRPSPAPLLLPFFKKPSEHILSFIPGNQFKGKYE
jgi:hypothetical protein